MLTFFSREEMLQFIQQRKLRTGVSMIRFSRYIDSDPKSTPFDFGILAKVIAKCGFVNEVRIVLGTSEVSSKPRATIGLDEFITAVEASRARTFSIDCLDLNGEDAIKVVSILSNPEIQNFRLNLFALSEAAVAKLIGILSKKRSLVSLDLLECRISSPDMLRIIDTLFVEENNLRELTLYDGGLLSVEWVDRILSRVKASPFAPLRTFRPGAAWRFDSFPQPLQDSIIRLHAFLDIQASKMMWRTDYGMSQGRFDIDERSALQKAFEASKGLWTSIYANAKNKLSGDQYEEVSAEGVEGKQASFSNGRRVY